MPDTRTRVSPPLRSRTLRVSGDTNTCCVLIKITSCVFVALPALLSCAVNSRSVPDYPDGPAAAEHSDATVPAAPDTVENQFDKKQSAASDIELGSANNKPKNPAQAAAADSTSVLSTEIEKTTLTVDLIDLPVVTALHTLVSIMDLQLVIEGSFEQKVTLRFLESPVTDILDTLAKQAVFKWSITNGLLRVSPDVPFLRHHKVDYLNQSRSVKSALGLATEVDSISVRADSTGGGAYSNSSNSVVQSESEHQFWRSLSEGLAALFSEGSHSETRWSINPEAGVVSVRANEITQREVERYLERLQLSLERQVMIEATILEISFSDTVDTGVDWRFLGADSPIINAAQVLHGAAPLTNETISGLRTPTAILSAIHQSNVLGDLNITVQLLSQLGKINVLSRPRLVAMNNQTAVLKVVDNRVYFSLRVQRTEDEAGTDISTESSIHTVPVGLVMSVTPFVSSAESVVLSVRPTVSRVLGFANDPNPELALANVRNSVPEIQVRELESLMKLDSGQIAILGGLVQEQETRSINGVPVLRELPLLGALFRASEHAKQKTELLVLLKPTIL